MKKNLIEAEHPGIILKEEFMEPYGVTAYRLVKKTGIDKKMSKEIKSNYSGIVG